MGGPQYVGEHRIGAILEKFTDHAIDDQRKGVPQLCELEGVEAEGGILIDRVFTHEEHATMVGATRQWVTKTLEKFSYDGIVRIADRKIAVL